MREGWGFLGIGGSDLAKRWEVNALDTFIVGWEEEQKLCGRISSLL